jgi:hypothetical protein
MTYRFYVAKVVGDAQTAFRLQFCAEMLLGLWVSNA